MSAGPLGASNPALTASWPMVSFARLVDRSPLGPELPSGEVHLWLADLEKGAGDPRVLSADEGERAARFRFDHHRRKWTTARVLLRRVLGRYLATEPHAVVLAEGEHGRRIVSWPDHSEWLWFSPARSGDVALVAVSGQHVGVDVDVPDRPGLRRHRPSGPRRESRPRAGAAGRGPGP